jgi:hypothetical protein
MIGWRGLSPCWKGSRPLEFMPCLARPAAEAEIQKITTGIRCWTATWCSWRRGSAPGWHPAPEASLLGTLFPDEVFAGLFDDVGRRTVPMIVAVVMVLQRIEGLPDQKAADRLAFDARWKHACGGLDFDYPRFATRCWWICGRGWRGRRGRAGSLRLPWTRPLPAVATPSVRSAFAAHASPATAGAHTRTRDPPQRSSCP